QRGEDSGATRETVYLTSMPARPEYCAMPSPQRLCWTLLFALGVGLRLALFSGYGIGDDPNFFQYSTILRSGSYNPGPTTTGCVLVCGCAPRPPRARYWATSWPRFPASFWAGEARRQLGVGGRQIVSATSPR